MPGFSMCLIILDIWQGFECFSGVIYKKVLNMLWDSYNNITIIMTNVIILDFLFDRFVHLGTPQLNILYFLNTS